MNTVRIFGYAMVLFFFSAFKSISACEYAGSNINFVKTQTEKALTYDDLNILKFYAFKALNAIEKSKKQLNDCNCEFASIGMEESAYLIKRTTKENNLKKAKELLKRALDATVSSIAAIEIHEKEHVQIKLKKLLAINSEEEATITTGAIDSRTYKERIDVSLEKYSQSLDKVVQTVNCVEAREFAERIFKNCELELLKEGLSEPKKYYNLETQKITAKALKEIKAKCKS